MTTKLAQHFTNDNPRKVWSLKDDAPQWLLNAIRDAHQGDLPNDWIWEECRAACDAIDEESITDEDGDGLHEHADSRVDVYTKDVFQWQADMCLTSTYSYAEEEANDLGSSKEDQVKYVQTIQYCAIRSIATFMVQAWRAASDEDSGNA